MKKTLYTSFALQTAKAALRPMIEQGLTGPRHIFVLAKMISENYKLTIDEAVTIVDEASKSL